MGLMIHLVITQLSECLSSQDFISIAPLIVTASLGGIKDSDIVLLQSKLRHRKVMVTLALRKHDSGDNSTFFTSGSWHSTRHTRHSLREGGFVFLYWASSFFLRTCTVLAWCLLPGCWATPKALCLGSAAMWVRIPQIVQWGAVTRGFMLGHKLHCMTSMS